MHLRIFPYLFLVAGVPAMAQTAPPSPSSATPSTPASGAGPASSSGAGQAIALDTFVVTAQLDQSREAILPSLGASSFFIDQQMLQNLPEGDDAPFNQVLLRAPGVAEDSAANGDLHVRGEHANLQYRINGVLLPEGITGFGLELDPRFVSSMQLITGSLPAQYGFRTAGVVDIRTRSGALGDSGGFSLFAGSFDTVRPSFEEAGSDGRLSYFADGSTDHNGIGIENPTAGTTPIHDNTDQSKAFACLSYILDRTSRISFMGSASYSTYQVPDTPGLPAGSSPNGDPWLPGSFNSAGLNENQTEQNTYGVITYQKSAPGSNIQVSAFGRNSGVHFIPDSVGDLYFNGVASDVDRRLYSAGLEGDASFAPDARHTVRAGAILLDESVSANSTTTVFPVDLGGNPTGPAYSIADGSTLHGLFAGFYLQDEWKIGSGITLNFGARFDVFDSSFDKENQLSPRLNLIWQPTGSTTLHAGYARYFTPPPVEDVPGSTVAKFDDTSNASPTDQDDPVRAERSDYFDAGIGQKLAPGWQMGLDGYTKRAKNQLDDGLFGQTLILSAFNYARGMVYGLEFTTSYTSGAFSAYANVARSVAKGEDWNSAEFLFDPGDLAYVRDHWIHLDHDQEMTGSFGTAYLWTEGRGSTRLYADVLYGTGLRTGATAADGTNIPNGGTVPAYCTLNLGGEQSFKVGKKRAVKIRVDVVNVADKSYELRNGTGVGVNAAQYGMRRAFFGSIGYEF